jgi:hypothetical protein
LTFNVNPFRSNWLSHWLRDRLTDTGASLAQFMSFAALLCVASVSETEGIYVLRIGSPLFSALERE